MILKSFVFQNKKTFLVCIFLSFAAQSRYLQVEYENFGHKNMLKGIGVTKFNIIKEFVTTFPAFYKKYKHICHL